MNYLLILFGLLPSFVWLIFYLKEDPHPEPKRTIIQTFIAGMASTVVILVLQIGFKSVMSIFTIDFYGFFSLLVFAAIEESLKFYSARSVIRRHLPDFDEPIDAMVYLIVAGLGFATVENLATILQNPDIAIEIASLRFVGATLLHSLTSGLIGYYWARSLISHDRRWLGYGFIVGISLHALFNYLIINFGANPFITTTLLLIGVGVFVLNDFEKLKKYSS